MNKKDTSKFRKNILDNPVPRKIIGLLLKKEMSPTDLAEKIYGKKNVRSGIMKWLKEFNKMNWIVRTDTNMITSKRMLFRARLNALGDFDKDEERFVSFVIERFWNPFTSNFAKSLTGLLLESLMILKLHKLKNTINRYNPKNDLDFYKQNKALFWNNKEFRDKFLDKIYQKGERIFNRNNFSSFVRRDFIFLSLLAPETLFYKLEGEHRGIGSPLHLTWDLMG